MNESDRVQVISGEYKSKTGIIVGTIPYTDMATGQKVYTLEKKPAGLCVVQFDDGEELTIEESELKVLPYK